MPDIELIYEEPNTQHDEDHVSVYLYPSPKDDGVMITLLGGSVQTGDREVSFITNKDPEDKRAYVSPEAAIETASELARSYGFDRLYVWDKWTDQK